MAMCEINTQPLLRVRGLSKHYGSVSALDDIGLDIYRGEIVCIIGPNGAGKSTLFNVLSGSLQPDSGEMTLAGENYRPDSSEAARAAGVGIVHQQVRIDPELKVYEAIVRTSFRASQSENEAVQFAAQVMADYGLEIDPHGRVGDLHRADATAVELLRVAQEETQLILLDEVTSSFNDLEISYFHRLALALAAEGRALIYISHRLDEVQALADRVVVFDHGRLTRELIPGRDTKADLICSGFNKNIELRDRPGEPVAQQEVMRLIDAVGHHGLAPVNLEIRSGEVLGITGLRRAGVDELIALLIGADPLSGGNIYLRGESVWFGSLADAQRNGIGYLSDRDDELGVGDDDTLGQSLVGADNATTLAGDIKRLRQVVQTIADFRIRAANLDQNMAELSGGDKQKVALLRWLRSDCDVLVLNHPTCGIDIVARDLIYTFIDELLAEGKAIILVTSDMTELISQCHRIGIMRDKELFDVFPNEAMTEDVVMEIALGMAERSESSQEVED